MFLESFSIWAVHANEVYVMFFARSKYFLENKSLVKIQEFAGTVSMLLFKQILKEKQYFVP